MSLVINGIIDVSNDSDDAGRYQHYTDTYQKTKIFFIFNKCVPKRCTSFIEKPYHHNYPSAIRMFHSTAHCRLSNQIFCEIFTAVRTTENISQISS